MIELKISDTETGKMYPLIMPTTWSDIKLKKRLKIAELCLLGNRMKVLKHILKLPPSVFFRMSEIDLAVLLGQIEAIDLHATASPIMPSFKHRKTWFYPKSTYFLPSDDFDNGTAIQFALAVEHYKKYSQSNDNEDFLSLIAVLALRKGVIICDNMDLEPIKNDLKSLSTIKKIVVLRFFEAILADINELGLKYGLWEAQKEGEGQEDENPVQMFGWQSVYRNLCDHDPTKYDILCQRRFFEVFQTLIERKMSQNYLNAQMKKQDEDNRGNQELLD